MYSELNLKQLRVFLSLISDEAVSKPVAISSKCSKCYGRRDLGGFALVTDRVSS